jgi:hypothetical protein
MARATATATATRIAMAMATVTAMGTATERSLSKVEGNVDGHGNSDCNRRSLFHDSFQK